jgi:hypothetical protein
MSLKIFQLSLIILHIDCGKFPLTEAMHLHLCNETHLECGDIHEIITKAKNLKNLF